MPDAEEVSCRPAMSMKKSGIIIKN